MGRPGHWLSSRLLHTLLKYFWKVPVLAERRCGATATVPTLLPKWALSPDPLFLLVSPMLWLLSRSFNTSLLFSCCVLLFVTPWVAACQAPLSSTVSWSLLKFMSTESVMPSNHLILCRPFFFPQSFPASGSFPVSRLLASGGHIIGASASLSVLLMNIQSWFPLGLTDLISFLSKRFSRVFSSTTILASSYYSQEGSSLHLFLQVRFLVNPYFFPLLCPYLCWTDNWLGVSRSRPLHTFALGEPFNENVTALGPTCSGIFAKSMKLHGTDAAAFKANSEDVEFPSPLVPGEFCLHEERQVPALVLRSFSQGRRKREPS